MVASSPSNLVGLLFVFSGGLHKPQRNVTDTLTPRKERGQVIAVVCAGSRRQEAEEARICNQVRFKLVIELGRSLES